MNESSVVFVRFPNYEAVRHLCGEIEQIPFCSNRGKYDKPLFVSLAHRIRNDYSHQADRIQGYDGGKATKIHAIVDGLGNPISFLLFGGQIYDSKIAVSLFETINIKGSHILADRAYSSQEIRSYIKQRDADYVISPK